MVRLDFLPQSVLSRLRHGFVITHYLEVLLLFILSSFHSPFQIGLPYQVKGQEGEGQCRAIKVGQAIMLLTLGQFSTVYTNES